MVFVLIVIPIVLYSHQGPFSMFLSGLPSIYHNNISLRQAYFIICFLVMSLLPSDSLYLFLFSYRLHTIYCKYIPYIAMPGIGLYQSLCCCIALYCTVLYYSFQMFVCIVMALSGLTMADYPSHGYGHGRAPPHLASYRGLPRSYSNTPTMMYGSHTPQEVHHYVSQPYGDKVIHSSLGDVIHRYNVSYMQFIL